MSTSPGQHVGFNTPFQEQIDYLVQKLRVPTERWDDIQRSAHDRAFMVAGATKADLLQDLHDAVVQRATDGKGLKQFQKDFKAIVQKHGWTGWTGEGSKAGEAWRTKVIYQTNMAHSYAAGRYRQMTDPDYVRLRPYWRYIHREGVRHPRPQHMAWHGLTLRHDHPFWQSHYPPNGWGCGCRIAPVGKAEGERSRDAGLGDPPDGWDAPDPKTGAPAGIDKGFDYAPGASVGKTMQSFIDSKLVNLDAPIGAQMWGALRSTVAKERVAAFKDWSNAIRVTGKTTGAYQVVGALDSELLGKMRDLGVMPANAAMVVRDMDVWHTFRDAKSSALDWDWYAGLPEHIEQAQAVILDKTVGADPSLLYVFDVPGSKGAKLVLKLNYQVMTKDANGMKQKQMLNVFRTGGLVDLASMNQPGYIVIRGEMP